MQRQTLCEACQRQNWLAKLFAKLPNWMSTRVKIADKVRKRWNEVSRQAGWDARTRMSMSFEFVCDYWHARRLLGSTIKYKLRIRRVCARAALSTANTIASARTSALPAQLLLFSTSCSCSLLVVVVVFVVLSLFVAVVVIIIRCDSWNLNAVTIVFAQHTFIMPRTTGTHPA